MFLKSVDERLDQTSTKTKNYMGYIENNLLNGEEIKFEANLHWLVYLKPILVTILVLALFGFAVYMNYMVAGLIGLGIFLIIIFIWCLEING